MISRLYNYIWPTTTTTSQPTTTTTTATTQKGENAHPQADPWQPFITSTPLPSLDPYTSEFESEDTSPPNSPPSSSSDSSDFSTRSYSSFTRSSSSPYSTRSLFSNYSDCRVNENKTEIMVGEEE